MVRRGESLTTWDIAEDFIHGLERCRLCSCCHLLAFQAVIEFLGLLVFAALFSKCCYQVLILSLELVLIYMHVCSHS